MIVDMNVFLLNILTAVESEPVSTLEELDYSGLFIKMVVLLVVVIVLGVILLRYFMPSARLKGKKASHLFEVMSAHRLEQKKSVYIVRLGTRYFALGASEQNLNLLTELEGSDLIE
jgi:flagellar biogenesis protein FliO